MATIKKKSANKGKAKPRAVLKKAPPKQSQGVETLRRELAEAARQQAATSDIFRMIAKAPGDPATLLKTIAENAAGLCDATDATIWRAEGKSLLTVAHHGAVPLVEDHRPLNRRWPAGRSVVDRKTVHV